MVPAYLLITLIIYSSLTAENHPTQVAMEAVPRRRIHVIIDDNKQQELGPQTRVPSDPCLCYLFWRFMCCSEKVATETPSAGLPQDQ